MLYPISIKGRCGFIDSSGKTVVEPRFLSVSGFSEGIARVTVRGLTYEDRLFGRHASGYIDERGEFVLGPGSPPGFEFTDRDDYSYGDFHEGLATFWIGDSSGIGGYIDRSGKVAIAPQYQGVEQFSQGLAFVSLRRKDKKVGPSPGAFINPQGKIVFRVPKGLYVSHFSEGLCEISSYDGEGHHDCYVINLAGDVVIPAGIYSQMTEFVDGIARVCVNQKEGYIDQRGKLIIPAVYDDIGPFEQNALATAECDGKGYIINRRGERLHEIACGEIVSLGPLRNGLAWIESKGKVGYINDEGKLQIPFRFDSCEDFEGELALVEKGRTKGYINRAGEFVWKTTSWD